MSTPVKIFVLDTNVLIHDPNALFNFEEHDVYIPMIVLEELDRLKSGPSQVAADARQAVRAVDGVLFNSGHLQVTQGVPIKATVNDEGKGRLFIQMSGSDIAHNGETSSQKNDNQIIHDVVALQAQMADRPVILVTKDINMRLKAKGGGIDAEDYQNDQLITDIERLTTGYHVVTGSFWERMEAIEPQK